MSNSINTNIAAFFAQGNITTASNAATENVARLSSGNAIVEASDNVTALAIGTSIGSQVSLLQTAQTNAAQGTSLLQVADGALAQIQAILQQQQSIANQAQSGTLTDTDRGFLNQQFAQLTLEINSLAQGTTFNGVELINGAIATGGSTSSNPLQNTPVVGSSTTITPAGFTDLTNAPTPSNIGANQADAGTTYSNGVAFTGSATGFTTGTTITQPTGSYDKSLYGNIGTAGTFSTVAIGSVGAITAYNINYTSSDGTVYSGSIAPTAVTGTLTSGTFTLTATTNPLTHATLAFTVGATGFTLTHDNSLAIDAALAANTTGVIYKSGTFDAAPHVTQISTADPSLHGDLSQGTFTVQLATDATHTDGTLSTALGYIVDYTLNGTTYSGFLAGTNGGTGTAGDTGVLAGQTVTLSAGASHASLTFTTNTAFGAAEAFATAGDQSANIKSALTANFVGATALNATASAAVTGQAAQAGIGLVSATSNPTKNDTTFVGDLSTGVFTVTGSASAGYNVSYAINSSTYQGTLSAGEVANGGTLVLDNGTGSLAFAITGGSANTLTSTALQTALTNQFAAATAHATHTIATTLESNGSGGTIPGSAITAASTAGTILDGFDGANAQLTSSLFTGGATNLPPISDFTATGSGTSTVFSVNVGGSTYTTQGTVNDTPGTLATDTFDGSVGILNFYLNGDKTTNPDEVLKLNLASIGSSAKITTTADVTSVVDALNTAFGGGGASGTGGLTFQLGSNASANVTVNIASATSSALFGGASIDVSTATTAATAATAVTAALNAITASRSGVGAYETQFNFASAALQTSVQNETAAESSLLDTNIATESTAFATNQVKLQAGISVLAQANQQTQALLKLIG